MTAPTRDIDPTRQAVAAALAWAKRNSEPGAVIPVGMTEQAETTQHAIALAGEVARFRAALPQIVGCSHGDFACCVDGYGWAPCCQAKQRAVELGLWQQPKPHDEDDGA